jgi:hypothetical protein
MIMAVFVSLLIEVGKWEGVVLRVYMCDSGGAGTLCTYSRIVCLHELATP